MEKTCTKCKLTKPVSEFYVQRKGKKVEFIYKPKCKACEIQKSKNEYHSLSIEERQNTRKVRHDKLGFRGRKNYKLRHLFGISIDEYEEMVEKQNNLCFICSNPPQNGLSLGVDHNHNTGKIRKLLCVNCNTMIGHSKEDVTILERTIEYIKSHAED